jgi:formyltetrahydrofolate deformylase
MTHVLCSFILPPSSFIFSIPMSSPTTLLMTLNCPDQVGLLARITGFVAEQHGNFVEVNQYTDTINRWFLARFAFEIPAASSMEQVRTSFAPLAIAINASWSIRDSSRPVRTVLLVSKEDHCLADLLWRWRSREMNIDVPLVISNHELLRDSVEKEGLPFLHIPIPADLAGREAAYRRISDEICGVSGELTILCRYMQILPGWFCEEHHNRVINIHHSLLPAFAGADPYRKAYDRGVKLIGATCHYATAELDAGPIIHQEMIHIEHFHTPADMRRLGRDCEKLSLARGVRLHVDDRVVVHNSRAIVFGD